MRFTREQIIANALANAIDILNQIGCSYTITDANGVVTTNIIQPKKRNDFSALNITQRLLDSTIGQDVFFECPADVNPLSLQSAICGHAYKVFGSKDNYTTSIDREANGVLVICGQKKSGLNLAAALADSVIDNASRRQAAKEAA